MAAFEKVLSGIPQMDVTEREAYIYHDMHRERMLIVL